MPVHKIDEVGHWTEIKLRIIKDYSKAYATVLNKQPYLSFAYIDGFAGAGEHISRTTGEPILGSPAIALNTQPNFHFYHFVDMDGSRADHLRDLSADRPNVAVYRGDCNDILLDEVFPQCRREDYRRALCLLDPYDLNPKWSVVQKAGEMKSIEIFLNFMLMDANMNVLWKNPDKVQESQKERMNAFWGDDSWRTTCYVPREGVLFPDLEDKVSNEAVVEAYRSRLRTVAGFKHVPEPIPMKNRIGSTIYYLFFASNNETGYRIAQAIMQKYRHAGEAVVQ